MGYLRQTVKGLGWIGGLRGLTRFVTFIKLAILARILTPFDFGLFGIAALVLAFLEIIPETGINIFLLQRKEGWKDFLDSAWVISITRGILVSLTIFLLAPFISNFFDNPDVISLLYITCFIPLVRGFINPANIIFQKELNFSKEFLYRLALMVTEFSVSVYLAIVLKSPLGLILAILASAVVEVFISFLISPRPKFKFDWNKSKSILYQGRWVTGFGIFNYLFTQGDDIAVGRILGESPLGIYQNAYKLATLPTTELTDVIYRVTFPIYSKMSEEKQRLKEAIKKQVLFTSIFMFAIGCVLFIYSREIVLIVLGSQWIEAAGVVKVLAFLGAVRGISFSFNSLFLALEKQKYVTYITFTSLFAMVIVLFPMIKTYGIVGAAASEMIASIVSLPVAFYLMRKTFKDL